MYILLRYALLHENPQVYRSFMTFEAKVLYFVFSHSFAFGIGYVTALSAYSQEVSLLPAIFRT